MAVPNEQERCVPTTCINCGRESAPTDKRCLRCGGIAFVKGHPLTWWPLRFEDGEARFLFPKLDPAPERMPLDYTPKPLIRPATSARRSHRYF